MSFVFPPSLTSQTFTGLSSCYSEGIMLLVCSMQKEVKMEKRVNPGVAL